MILPVTIIGNPVLRKEAEEIPENYEELQELVDNMFETMYNADGVGLAAPQIGKALRLFVIDAEPMAEDEPELLGFKKVFVNPIIFDESDELVAIEEGCLSIPGIREEVKRHNKLKIEYYDENFEYHEETYEGMKARIIQHEYDHLDGILFTDKIAPLRKRLLKSKLSAVSKGKFDVSYKYQLGIKKPV